MPNRKWTEHYECSGRSLSMNVGIRLASESALANDIKHNLVSRGLTLAGLGLNRSSIEDGPNNRQNVYKMGKESVRDRHHTVNVSTVLATKFNKDLIPEEYVIDFYFNRLLADTVLEGYGKTNMAKMSYQRKWELVCKEHNAEQGLVSEKEGKSDDELTMQLILSLKEKLKGPITQPHVWYQLEKVLRQKMSCLIFISQGGISKLLEHYLSVARDMEYVYLNCFKSIINHDSGRNEMHENIEVTRMLCNYLSNNNSQTRTRLLATDILLLLTYVDSERVSRELELLYSPWINTVYNTIVDRSQWLQSLFVVQKPQQLVTDYLISTTILINALIERLPLPTSKSKAIKLLKDAGIHKVFYQLDLLSDKLDSEVLFNQISKYKSTESAINSKMATEKAELDVSFARQVKTIAALTKGTALEFSMSKLLDAILQIVTSRTSAESVKLIELFQAVLDYLLEHSYDKDELSEEAVLKASLDQLMTRLQSVQINERAVQELEEMKVKVEHMKNMIADLEQQRSVTKGAVLEKWNSTKETLSNRMNYITELEERLETIEKQRKNDRIKYEREVVHRDSERGYSKNSISLFATLKNGNGLPHSNIGRSATLVRSPKVNFDKIKSEDVSRRSISGPEGIRRPKFDKDAGNLKEDLVHTAKAKKLSFITESKSAPVLDEHDDDLEVQSPKPRLSSNSCNTNKGQKSVNEQNHVKPLTVLTPPPPPPPFPMNLIKDLSVEEPLPQTLVKAIGAPPPPPMPTSLLQNVVHHFRKASQGTYTGPSVCTPPPPPPPLPLSLTRDALEGSRCISTMRSRPRVKMKQIHWDKIDDVRETIWCDDKERAAMNDELESFGVFKEIEDLFKVVPTNTKSGYSSINPLNTRNGKITLLSNDLAQQFGINLHIFSHYPVEVLVEKVLQCDSEVMKNQSIIEFFSKDDINHMPQSIQRMFAPYATNYFTNEKPEKDPSVLERADRIYLELFYNLRSYWAARSKYLLVLLTYERDYYDTLYKLQRIDDATKAIRNSTKLKHLFFLIVEVGNYMNNKQAPGIQLSSLNKFAFTKTCKDNNLSFIHVIEHIVRTRYPELHDFMDDLEKISDVSNFIVQHVEEESQEFYEKIYNLERSLSVGKLSDTSKFHPKDNFLAKTESNMCHARKKADLLKGQCTLTMGDFNKLMRYWAENPNNMHQRNTFFQKFIDFITLFKKAIKENSEREEIRRVCEQRRLLIKPVQYDRVKKENDNDDEKNSVRGSSNVKPLLDHAEDEQHAVDILIRRLRDVRHQDYKYKNQRDTKSDSSGSTLRIREREDGDLLVRTREMLMGVKKF
ncbi:HFR136Wp [Eremothecium sinecaudum]|uniref:HFR136Wp n=1 Tax=Eremothecium sinecaudum TaxID=45286 RepID=A0A120K2M6_9SACH|nr:HFR136Wp [Eremothecium sinecaudum]AMD21991.1 HFR136Wp [Eremothecium sinecaudum]